MRLFLLTLCLIGISILTSALVVQAKPPATNTKDDRRQIEPTSAIFLPLISQEGDRVPTVVEPRLPDSYNAEQATPPVLPDPNPIANCQSYIRFSNYTNTPIYVYWYKQSSVDLFYKLLPSGRQYWQHTYVANQWHVRDDQGRMIRTVTATRCDNSFSDIYISDLPPCGRITAVALWDLTKDRVVPGYASLTSGAVIQLEEDARVNLRVITQEVVESIKFTVNDVVAVKNGIPYSFPDTQQPWLPPSGAYTLVIEAYRQNDAQSALCDQRRLTIQLSSALTPSLTAAPTITPTLTPTSTQLATPTMTQTPVTTTPTATGAAPTFTPTATSPGTSPGTPPVTPTVTVTSSPCSGRINAVYFLNLATGQPIASHNASLDGATIDLANLPTNFNLELAVNGQLESVIFEVNNEVNSTVKREMSVENFAPYRYPGGDINPWRPTPGFYTVRIVAYSQDDAAGLVCDVKIITFTLTQTAATTTPTPTAPSTATSTATPTVTPALTNTPTATPSLGVNCLGDWVWRDIDADGQQDQGEPGLAAVSVYLLRDDTMDGRPDRVVGETVTNSAGAYAFCTLPPATYFVEFGAANGCINAPANIGDDDAIDSDASIERSQSSSILFTAGSVNSTIDAGFICN